MTALKPNFSVEPHTWNQFVAHHPQGHILQTSPWGTLKSEFGWTDERIALMSDGKPVAGAQILYRRLPARAGQLAYVPKGPLVDWEDEEQVTALLDALDQAVQSRGAIALSLEPNLRDFPAHRERLEALNLRPAPFDAIQPRRTLVVDITPDEEAILMAMKSKTRYNIRLAGRKGVKVRKAGEDEVSTFTELLAATAERADFGIHPPAYYEAAYRLFVPRDRARLLLAEVEGQPVAGLMVLALPPHSWYFYGASSTAHREKMPTYLIQWEAIRWAKSIGCTTYDLWGVPDADREQLEDEFTERHDGLWGVYRFKRGFGGELVRSVGAWDRVYAPVRYQVYTKALSIREELLNSESPDD
jgi:lipid II:glycine glycyltransferase (peptidoglycan interpeptide bridge formation enzyme)